MDVKAFLNGDLKEDIYMKQPQTFVSHDNNVSVQAVKELVWLETCPKTIVQAI